MGFDNEKKVDTRGSRKISMSHTHTIENVDYVKGLENEFSKFVPYL